MNGIMQREGFCGWLSSTRCGPLESHPGCPLSVTCSFAAEQNSMVRGDHRLFNHLPVEGHLRYFSLGLVNKAALSIHIQVVAET